MLSFQALQRKQSVFVRLTPYPLFAKAEARPVSRCAIASAAMNGKGKLLPALLAVALLLDPLFTTAEELACVTTEWKLLGANHKVCVESFSDPQIAGVTCHVSQARKGGVKGTIGVAEDPSQFSLSCRQTGPITLPAKLARETTVFSADTSLLFKETRVVRLWDEAHNTLVYLAISRKVIDGAPANSVSTVPVMPWGVR